MLSHLLLVSPLEHKLLAGRDFCLFCSMPYPQHLGTFYRSLAYHRHSIHIVEWVNTICLPSLEAWPRSGRPNSNTLRPSAQPFSFPCCHNDAVASTQVIFSQCLLNEQPSREDRKIALKDSGENSESAILKFMNNSSNLTCDLDNFIPILTNANVHFQWLKLICLNYIAWVVFRCTDW